MPASFQSELTVNAPCQTVFDAMVDLDGFQHWMKGLVRVDKLSDGPMAVRSSWREVRKLYGREGGEVFEVSTYDPPGRLDLYVDGSKGMIGKGWYKFNHTLAEVDGGARTRMTTDAEIDIPGMFFKLFGKMMLGSFRKAIEKDHQSFKAHLEGAASADA